MKRFALLAILFLIIGPLAIIAGEEFWRSYLKDWLGMRPPEECVQIILDRELKPQVAASTREYAEEYARDPENELPLYLQSQELLNQNLGIYNTDEHVDTWTEQIIEETSCSDFDTIHFLVKSSLGETIQSYTWDAIRSDIEP